MRSRSFDGEEYEYNPRLRKLILEVVENQMRDNNPPITNITYRRLLSLGYSGKRAKEMIAVVVCNHIYDIMKENKMFDVERYAEDLAALK